MFKTKALRCFSILLVLCITLMMSAYAAPYSDKGKYSNSCHGKHAGYLIGHGIIKGDGYGNYSLTDYVKRGDIVVMIVRAFKLSIILGGNFPDVSKESYYYDAIATAKSYGIAKGDGKHFHPKKYVTIGQAIMMIERAVKVASRNVVVDTSVDLHDMYSSKDLSKYATRKDVADMLYYILTGDTTAEEDYVLSLVKYTTKENTAVRFDSGSFSTVLHNYNNEDLSYVMFNLPVASYGTLYYDYVSSSNYDSLVSASVKYYVDDTNSGTPNISDITFVPYTNYSGTVNIYYTAYDKDGKSYTGTVSVTVENA